MIVLDDVGYSQLGCYGSDANLGACVYESDVSKQRFDAVRTRMVDPADRRAVHVSW